MGLLGFVEHLVAPIVKSPIIKRIGSTPAGPLGYLNPPAALTYSYASDLLKKKAAPSPGAQVIHEGNAPYQPTWGPQPSYNVTYGSPQYGGSGYDAYNLQPQAPYGGSPWGYSTMYSQPLTQPYQAYSAPQDRSWEDLTSLAGAVLPFFL